MYENKKSVFYYNVRYNGEDVPDYASSIAGVSSAFRLA